MKRIVSIITSLMLCTAAFANESESAAEIAHEKSHWNFKFGARYARIFSEMADRIATRNGYPIFSIDVGRNTSPADSNAFDRAFNYPTYGLATSIACTATLPFKSPDGYMKNIYNLYTFLEPDFIRTEKFSFGLKADWGVGYTNGIYDAIKNPGNSWIGSRVMIYYGFGPQIKFYPTPNWEIGLNAMLWHHSNGRTMLPNWGINEYGIELSTRYYLDAPYRGNSRMIEKEPYKGCFVWDIFAGAEPYMSFAVYDAFTYENEEMEKNPDYEREFNWPLKPALKAQIGADFMWKCCRIAASGITVQAMYYSNPDELRRADAVINRLYPERFTQEEKDNATYSPYYFGIGFTQELQYRRIVMFASVGVHIGRRIGLAENLDDTIFYQSLGGRYLIPGLDGTYLSFACKVRKFSRADNLELCIGKRF